MLKQVTRVLFFLIIFCIPFQVGYHFWPDFTFVGGVRIDYLSPTLYLLDVLIVLLLLCWFTDVLKNKERIKPPKLNQYTKIAMFLFVVGLVVNIFLSKSPQAHIFGTLKLLEFSLFSLFIALNFKRKDIPFFIDSLALASISASILSVWQFVNKGSVGGLWYFIGERTFSESTIGIARFGSETTILRPYAAFPHPNVLAFFLLFVVVFILPFLILQKKRSERVFLFIVFLLSTIALFLTFSRVILLLFAIFLLWFVYRNYQKYFGYIMLPVILLAVYYVIRFSERFVYLLPFLKDLGFRTELVSQSIAIYSQSPIFGVGMGNFFINQAPLIREISPVAFQPVHNIYLLTLVQMGIFGIFALFVLFYYAFGSIVTKLKTKDAYLKSFYMSVFIMFLASLAVGIFDHFIITLEQGQIVFAIILGLVFGKAFLPDRFEKNRS